MTNDKDLFQQAAERARRLRAELSAAPIVALSGVVAGNGGAGVAASDGLWTFRATLAAWRAEGGTLQRRPLTVIRTVTREELRSLMNSFHAHDLLRMRARVVDAASFGGAHAALEEPLGIEASDSELAAAAAELLKPVTFEDARFGTFTLDRRVDWFTAETAFAGARVRLSLCATEDPALAAALTVARALLDDAATWNDRVRAFAVERLLTLKNDCWLGDDEAPLAPERFKEKMSLDSITVYPSGSFEFWHDDADMFWGHSIQISGSLAEGLKRADIPG